MCNSYVLQLYITASVSLCGLLRCIFICVCVCGGGGYFVWLALQTECCWVGASLGACVARPHAHSCAGTMTMTMSADGHVCYARAPTLVTMVTQEDVFRVDDLLGQIDGQ